METFILTKKEAFRLMYLLSRNDIRFLIQGMSNHEDDKYVMVTYVQEREKSNMILNFWGTFIIKRELDEFKDSGIRELNKLIREEYKGFENAK